MTERIRPARIIRYTNLPDGLLSRLDKVRNILEIDKEQRELLSPSTQRRLDCTDHKETRVVHVVGGLHFASTEELL